MKFGNFFENILIILSAIFGVFVVLPLLFSFIYFPIRLCFVGKVIKAPVEGVSCPFVPSYDGGGDLFCNIVVKGLNVEPDVDYSMKDKLKPGQLAYFLYSKQLNKVIYLTNNKVSVIYVLFHYKHSSFLIFWFSLYFVGAIFFFTAREFLNLSKIVIQDGLSSVIAEMVIMEKVSTLIKKTLPIFSALTFAYVIGFVAIKMIIVSEHQYELISNFCVFYLIVLTSASPLLIAALYLDIKNTQTTWLRNLKSSASLGISIYGIVKTIQFMLLADTWKTESWTKVVIDFLKFLAP